MSDFNINGVLFLAAFIGVWAAQPLYKIWSRRKFPRRSMYIIRVLSVRVFSLIIRSVALCLSECIVCYALCAGGRMHFWRMDFIFEELQRKMFPWERSIKIKFTLAK